MADEPQEERRPPFRASDGFFVCLGMTGELRGKSIDRRQTPKSWGRGVRICVTTGLFTDEMLNKLPHQRGKER